MNGYRSSRRMLWGILITLLLVGCGASAATTPSEPPPDTEADTTAADSQSEGQLVEVTFNGTDCTVSGPAQVPVGEHQIALKNLTDQGTLRVMVGLIKEDKTFEDLTALQSAPGEFVDPPYWVSHQGRVNETYDESLEATVATFDFILTGPYYIALSDDEADNLWLCSSLEVVEAP